MNQNKANCLPDNNFANRLLKTKPMLFQEMAAERLKEMLKEDFRVFLADEPGLGKTFSSTKLICDMAKDYWEIEKNEDIPFLVLYIAPNKELLTQNKIEIIRKAKSYANDNYRIIDIADLISKERIFYDAIKDVIQYKLDRKKKELEKKKYSRITSVSGNYLESDILPEILEKMKKNNSAIFGNMNINAILQYFAEHPDNKSQNLHHAMKNGGIGDGSRQGKNRAIYFDTLIKSVQELQEERTQNEIDLLPRIDDILTCVKNTISKDISELSYSEMKNWIEGLKTKKELEPFKSFLPNWDEYKYYKGDYENPDRLAYIFEILKSQAGLDKGIYVLTASQGVLFDSDGSLPKREKEIIQSADCKSRYEFSKKFLKEKSVQLVIWDEFHRYSTKLTDNNAFFEAEKEGLIRNLFISATPYKTYVSDKEVIKDLYSNAAELDDTEEMSSLPTFKDCFAPLFCFNHNVKEVDLVNAYDQFNKNPLNEEFRDKLQELLRTRMVRHERSRLQKEHEKHVRKYLPEDNIGSDYEPVFKNTYMQSKLLEKAGYDKGARKWSLSLPWILSFSTSRGKVKKEVSKNGKKESVLTFYELLDPTGKTNISETLFVYDNDGKVKDWIGELPVQNLAFFEICQENVKERMRQLLWVPATMPLYYSGDKSIFTAYKYYSKLLVFAEYRYLQRGGSRLLSDYVKFKNITEKMPESFPCNLELASDRKRLDKLVSFDLLGADYRNSSLDDLIRIIKSREEWCDADCLASVASPAVCAKRLGMNPSNIESAFNSYIHGEGKKEVLWNWLCENGYSEENKWEEGIYKYCAEGNLYSVLEEWMFVMKAEDKEQQICDCLNYSGSTVHVQTHKTTLNQEDGFAGKCSFAEQLCNDFFDNGGYADEEKQMETSKAFSSPLWPMILFAGKGAQEGIDMHEYALRIMHMTLPRGAVSYEQRNGRIDRFRSLLVRRRVAEYYKRYRANIDGKPCMDKLITRSVAQAIYEQDELGQREDQLFPNWHFSILEESEHHFEELIPMWDYTEEASFMVALDEMLRSYRGSMGLSSNMDCDKGIDLSAHLN